MTWYRATDHRRCGPARVPAASAPVTHGRVDIRVDSAIVDRAVLDSAWFDHTTGDGRSTRKDAFAVALARQVGSLLSGGSTAGTDDVVARTAAVIVAAIRRNGGLR